MKITLISKDAQKFAVDVEAIRASKLVRKMLDDLGMTDCAIPLPNVDGAILEKIIVFCEHYTNGVCSVSATRNIDAPLSEWDTTFCDVDDSTIIEILAAANYMDINALVLLSSKNIASRIKNLTTEQLRERFHITNDLTPEEELEIAKENDWLIS